MGWSRALAVTLPMGLGARGGWKGNVVLSSGVKKQRFFSRESLFFIFKIKEDILHLGRSIVPGLQIKFFQNHERTYRKLKLG